MTKDKKEICRKMLGEYTELYQQTKLQAYDHGRPGKVEPPHITSGQFMRREEKAKQLYQQCEDFLIQENPTMWLEIQNEVRSS